MLFRRDEPDTIVPALATAIGIQAGTDAWGAWAQVTAGLSLPFLLGGISISGEVGATLTTNTSVKVRKRTWFAVGTGVATSEVEVARTALGMGLSFGLTGVVDDVVQATGYALFVEGRRLTPVLINPNTRIAVRAYQTGSPSEDTYRIYLIGYDAQKLAASRWPLHAGLFQAGVSKSHSDDKPATTEVTVIWGGTAWAWGSWVEVTPSLDANYLIEGMLVNPISDTATGQDSQIEVGTGAAGSETPRGRMGFPNTPVSGRASDLLPFPVPFIAFKGERLAVRAAMANNRNKGIRLLATRLHKD